MFVSNVGLRWERPKAYFILNQDGKVYPKGAQIEPPSPIFINNILLGQQVILICFCNIIICLLSSYESRLEKY